MHNALLFFFLQSKFASGNHLLLYTLTVSGVAYVIRLRSNFDYGTSSLVPTDEFLQYNTQVQPHYGAITAVAATAGCLLIGRSDGSVGCFQLGILDSSTSGLWMVSAFLFILEIFMFLFILLVIKIFFFTLKSEVVAKIIKLYPDTENPY